MGLLNGALRVRLCLGCLFSSETAAWEMRDEDDVQRTNPHRRQKPWAGQLALASEPANSLGGATWRPDLSADDRLGLRYGSTHPLRPSGAPAP